MNSVVHSHLSSPDTYRMLYRTALHFTRSQERAEEAVQDACRNMLQSTTYDESKDFDRWARTAVINAARNRYTSEMRRARLNATLASPISTPPPTPLAVILKTEARERLLRKIGQIPSEEQQTALRGHYFDGLSYQDLATALDTSISNVKNHLFRGRDNLGKILTQMN